MRREDPQFKLRIPAVLKEQLGTAARHSGRSVNAEIVDRLTKSFSGESGIEGVADKAALIAISWFLVEILSCIKESRPLPEGLDDVEAHARAASKDFPEQLAKLSDRIRILSLADEDYRKLRSGIDGSKNGTSSGESAIEAES